jgi:alcohol dehydrogenase
VVARESIIPIDPEVPLEIAVMFGCAVITGVGAVVNTARVPPGSSVTVFGLGGVGLSAVMGARAAGADPIVAVDVVAAKLELAGRLGATHRIDARTADPVEAVRGLTGGGSEYAFECAGAEDSLAQAYAATARGGTTITVSLPHPSRHLSVSAVNLVVEERTVKGSYMGSAVPRRDIPRFLALHRAGLLPVEQLVSQTLILDEINGAFDALAEGQVVRQVVRLVRH